MLFFIRRPHQKNNKAPPALPRCGADLPSTAVPHATERRQPKTQYLPTYDTPPFRCFSSLRRQHHKPTRILPSPVVALYLLQEQNKAPNVFVCTGRDHSTAGCLICSESHIMELTHRGVRSHHSMAGCVICSESHMSELPHRGVRQNGKSHHLIHFPHMGRSHRTCRSHRTPVR